MIKLRRPVPLRGAVIAVCASLLALALPALGATAEPVPPAIGEIVGTFGIGTYDPSGTPSRVLCTGTRSLTGVRAFRVDNDVPEPITGVQGICSDVFADTGVVTLTDPQSSALIGVAQDDIAESECAPGAVVTGFRGRAGFAELQSLQMLCGYLNADGSLTPAPPAAPAFGSEEPLPVEITCDPGESALGYNGNTANSSAPNGGEITFFALECASLSFAGQPPVDPALNTTWPTATLISDSTPASNLISTPGQARWYKFAVQPDSTVQVDLTGLDANYDLTVFKDIEQSFRFLTSTEDLALLGAEFAADAYSPSAFSPSAFSPSAFSPSAFSPSAFSPSAFSPSAFSPSAFSPSAFSPSAFSPSAFSPSAFSPSAFSPAVSLPSAFSSTSDAPRGLTEEQYADAFASAQTRSLLAVSAREGTATESVRTATWANTGFFYVRVIGRNGATSTTPFQVSLTTTGGSCGVPLDTFPGSPSLIGEPGAARTVLLTDSARLPGVNLAQLQSFADRPEINGVVVDAADVPLVRDLNGQADDLVGCGYAKNLVAQSLRDIVNSYRDGEGTLQYVVLVGGDDVIPYFRYADSSGLGPESDYVPPVLDTSASQTSLRSNLVLGQDAYGSVLDVSLKGTLFPLPELAVGRLIETPTEIAGTIDRYVALTGGTLPTPSSSLVTGYDFLTDAADAFAAGMQAGIAGGDNDTLITDQGVPPTVTTVGGVPDRQHSWTADDLRAQLLGTQRHDVTFLAGHFSANSTLAADYDTTLLTTDLAASGTDFENTLVLSPGCHSGYTILDRDVVPGVTLPLDWTQAFVQQGATLVAGTGYQYGDTDFLEYSERLYNGMLTQLRYGEGAVPLGVALTRAKQDYLASTVTLTGIHQKAVLQAALYGLPMLGLDLPTGRLTPPGGTNVATTPVDDGPGSVLGLTTATVSGASNPGLTTSPRTDVDGNPSGVFTYATGPDGVVTNPGQPVLPLDAIDVTSPGEALRGIGFRTGTYADTPGITPLTGAPATEINAVHTPFVSSVFFPPRLASANYFDAVGSQGTDGRTRVNVTASQYRTDGPATNILRQYSAVGLQLYYSANVDFYGGNIPALAGPPTLSGTQSTVDPNGITISTRAVGDPSAGIQQVWVTYTAQTGPWDGSWASLDLQQDPADTTLWTATLPLPTGQSAADVRFLVQAVNGVGLVGADDNQGGYYVPGTAPGLTPPGPRTPTALALDAPTVGDYRDSISVSATLSGPAVLGGRVVTFAAGSASVLATTNAAGQASATLPLIDRPGGYEVTASYDGDDGTEPSGVSAPVTIRKLGTGLQLSPATVTVEPGSDSGLVATLSAAGLPLRQKTVYLVVRDGSGAVADAVVGASDLQGEVELGAVSLPPGSYAVTASFGAAAVDLGETTLDATDPDYLTSSATATLVVSGGGGSPPVAVADSHQTASGSVLSVPAPGVLANDTDADGDQLTATLAAPPTAGTVVLNPNGSFTYTPGANFVGTATFTYTASDGSAVSQPATVAITVTEPVPPGCTIIGTPGNDTLRGGNDNDVICGLGGNDVLLGSNGNDTLIGGSGNDRLDGSNGNDRLEGGSGHDTLIGSNGNDVLGGGAGNDILQGGNNNDRITGGPGNDQLFGENNNDTLDSVDGVNGNDTINGGLNTDTCRRDPGDPMTGCP